MTSTTVLREQSESPSNAETFHPQPAALASGTPAHVADAATAWPSFALSVSLLSPFRWDIAVVLLDGPITCVYKQLKILGTVMSSSCVASLAALVGSGTSTYNGRCARGLEARGASGACALCQGRLIKLACGVDDPEA